MFTYPATELFRGEDRRVVWSVEEYEAALAEGWSHEKTAPVEAPAPVETSTAPEKKTSKKA